MRHLFGYIYFRVAQFYFKSDGSNAVRALLAVSMIPTVTLMIVMEIFLHYFFNLSEIRQYAKLGGIIISVIYLTICYVNYLIYRNSFFDLRDKWNSETSEIRLLKGSVVILSLIGPWIIFFLFTVYFPISKG